MAKKVINENKGNASMDWNEFEKRYHEMERYGKGEPRKVYKENMAYIEDGLIGRGITGRQLSSLLSTIVEESGGDPFSTDSSGNYRGLIQFSRDRYSEKDFNRDKKAGWKKAIDNQLDSLVSHLNEYGGDYGFLRGDKRGGFKSGNEAKDVFWGEESSIADIIRALTYGFIRPSDKAGTTKNRTKVASIIDGMINSGGKFQTARTKKEGILDESSFKTFGQAYGHAKKVGVDVFLWNGKKYSTKEDGGRVAIPDISPIPESRDATSVGSPGISAVISDTKVSPSAKENPVISMIASFLPGVGEVLDVKDMAESARNGDYLTAAITGLGLLPIPVIADAASKGLKYAVLKGRKAPEKFADFLHGEDFDLDAYVKNFYRTDFADRYKDEISKIRNEFTKKLSPDDRKYIEDAINSNNPQKVFREFDVDNPTDHQSDMLNYGRFLTTEKLYNRILNGEDFYRYEKRFTDRRHGKQGDETMMAGTYDPYSDEIILYDPKTSTNIHELRHRADLGNIPFLLSNESKNYLKDAYVYKKGDPDFLLEEAIASNTELRALIYQRLARNSDKLPDRKTLDKRISDISGEDLVDAMVSSNGYFDNYIINGLNIIGKPTRDKILNAIKSKTGEEWLNKVRKALINVPAVAGVALAPRFIFEENGDATMKEGGDVSRLAPRDATSVGGPGSAEVPPVTPGPAARGSGPLPFVASLLPGVGDVIDAYDFIQAAADKDKVGMALAAAGFIPIIGDAFQEAVKLNKARRLAKMSERNAVEPSYRIEETDKELLDKMPEYAHPDSPYKEAYNYHVERLKNNALEEVTGRKFSQHVRNNFGLEETVPGVYDKVFDIADETEDLKPAIMDYLQIPSFLDYMVGPRDIAAAVETMRRQAGNSPMFAVGRGHSSIIKDSRSANARMIEGDLENVAKSHELDHAVNFVGPAERAERLKETKEWFDPEKTGLPGYFESGIELAARGSQLKDYFGLTDSSQKLTSEMLKYAARHYVDDVSDNDITRFFNGITNWDKAAEWLSKYATVFSGAVMIPKVIEDADTDEKKQRERDFTNRFTVNRGITGDYWADPEGAMSGINYSPFRNGGRAIGRRSKYIKKVLRDEYRLSGKEADRLVDGITPKTLLSNDYYDAKSHSFGIGGWTGSDLLRFLKKYKDGGLADQIDFLASKYWEENEDKRPYVVKRIGNKEYYTDDPVIINRPDVSRTELAIGYLPWSLSEKAFKRISEGKESERKYFEDGGETGEIQDYIYDRLTKEHGIPPVQAIGIVANLTQESSLDYDALGDNGKSYGIQQWQGGRRKSLFDFAKSRGNTEPDLDDQIDFLVNEYKNGNGFQFHRTGRNLYRSGETDRPTFDYFQYSQMDFDNASNIYDASRAWAQGFGRGNKEAFNMERRFRIAKDLAARYGVDAGSNISYTDMGYDGTVESPVLQAGEPPKTEDEKARWMEEFGDKMLAAMLADDNDDKTKQHIHYHYEVEDALDEDRRENEAKTAELERQRQAQQILASIIDGIKLDIKGVTEV